MSKELADRNGFKLLYPENSIIREDISLSWWVDGFKIVNLPKLKTHDIMELILVMRNLLCCNEVCEFSAIKLNKSFLLRLIR